MYTSDEQRGDKNYSNVCTCACQHDTEEGLVRFIFICSRLRSR